jgi:hypothetical protein
MLPTSCYIVDGLDECDTTDTTPVAQGKVLDIISLLFQKYYLPIRSARLVVPG